MNEKVIKIQRIGSFSLLVFTTMGGMGRECITVLKKTFRVVISDASIVKKTYIYDHHDKKKDGF